MEREGKGGRAGPKVPHCMTRDAARSESSVYSSSAARAAKRRDGAEEMKVWHHKW
jgi:hypothetical protein